VWKHEMLLITKIKEKERIDVEISCPPHVEGERREKRKRSRQNRPTKRRKEESKRSIFFNIQRLIII